MALATDGTRNANRSGARVITSRAPGPRNTAGTSRPPWGRRPYSTTMIEPKPTRDLIPHPRNPRTITRARLDHLKRVLAADPEMLQARPIIVQASTGFIVAGNQRRAAALELLDAGDARFETLPTYTGDLDDERALEWAIRDNEGFGERDDLRTAEILRELAAKGRDLDLTGLTSSAIDSLIAKQEKRGDPEIVPPKPDRPKSKRGQVYQLGAHRLVCGDATDPAAYKKLAADPIDLLLTDPPYNVDVSNARGLKIANDRMPEDSFRAFLTAAFTCAAEALRPGGSAYVFHADTHGLAFRQSFDAAGFDLKQVLVWVKNSMVLGRQDYQWKHEPVLYGWKRGASHKWYGDFNKTTVQDEDLNVADATKPELQAEVKRLRDLLGTTVQREDRPTASSEHPTMKPVPLIELYLTNSTKVAGTVLDPFGGAGSTLIAAERTLRVAHLIELDARYCDVIRQRYADYTEQPDLAP